MVQDVLPFVARRVEPREEAAVPWGSTKARRSPTECASDRCRSWRSWSSRNTIGVHDGMPDETEKLILLPVGSATAGGKGR